MADWRQRLELSLRLNATFAAMATALVLLHKTVGLAIPTAAVSLLAAQLAVGKRRYDATTLNWACVTVGIAATGVAASDYAMLPVSPTLGTTMAWSSLAGLAAAGLARLGLWLATPAPPPPGHRGPRKRLKRPIAGNPARGA